MFPEPQVDRCLQAFEAGEEVLAFYHSNLHPRGHRFVHVCALKGQPLCGLSSGWLWATVQHLKRPGDPRVQVRFVGPFRDPLLGTVEVLDLQLPSGLVRPKGWAPAQPLLSVLLLRWWDYGVNPTWSDFAVTNDGMLRDLVDGPCGLFPVLAGEFELYTVFIKRSADLEAVLEHWAQAVLQGINTVVWYFLWPCLRRDADTEAGCVREKLFFDLQRRMERVGLRSGWPHPSMLYRQLCGKLWVSQMCLNKGFRVPPTVTVHYTDVRSDPHAAAQQALSSLERLRARLGGAGAARGVAKLGFSWQGDDVLPFDGVDNLARVLCRLLGKQGSEQLTCLVQEMVPDVVCEHRVLCFRNAAARPQSFVREHLWLRMKPKGEHHNHQACCEVQDFALASAKVVSRDEAPREFFGGSADARDAVESATDDLVDEWLLWFTTEDAEPPPVTRLDFLVSWRPDVMPAVWTCEVGECGASLCSVECEARNCAVLNWAIRHDASGRFPAALPPIRRNNGWKS
ncbi:unnamed protein product [Effrenium voratum]|uniref:Uncharacterized protein n=1 Tax=Effrenium voratum TaxID=2562239 RepID=A0AA36MT06_9DINO|nr:unnamed protein product [Effrenium voratum]CAJ1413121.1 unnamed protein product [Effrenium voratum]